MALYMIQFSYTQQAWSSLVKNPQDRMAALKELVAKFNSKVVGLYYSNGDYDGMAIIEAPNDETSNALLFAIISAGHIKATKTVHLYTVDEIMASLKKAGTVTYKGPG